LRDAAYSKRHLAVELGVALLMMKPVMRHALELPIHSQKSGRKSSIFDLSTGRSMIGLKSVGGS